MNPKKCFGHSTTPGGQLKYQIKLFFLYSTGPIAITICVSLNIFVTSTKIIANLPVNTTLLIWNWWDVILLYAKNKTLLFPKNWQITLLGHIAKWERPLETIRTWPSHLQEPFLPSLGKFLTAKMDLEVLEITINYFS